jgi:tetratricopeptide (TPR) repeat protein
LHDAAFLEVEMTKLITRSLAGVLLCVTWIALPASAQEVFRNPAMEASDEVTQVMNRARDRARQGDPDGAIKEYREALKLRGGNCPECFEMIGKIYFQLGKYKDAAVALKSAVDLKPSNEAELCNALGVTYFLQRDKKSYEDAVIALKRSIELSNGKVVKAYYNLGCSLIKLGKDEQGVASLRKYLELAPNANDADEVRAVIANPKLAGERVAPAFKVSSTRGEELSLAKLRGKVVLLDFWATWCGPCRYEMPEVRKIWKKYSSDHFLIVGINLDDDRAAFDGYVKEEGLTWPQYFTGGGWDNIVARQYGVHAIPHTVLIDEEGVIRAVGLRGSDLSNKIGELLKKNSKNPAEKTN